MKIKTISIFICIILITSATCVPIFGSPNILQIDNINKRKLSTNELNSFNKNNYVEDILLKIINDFGYGKINLEDMNQLYLNPYINQNIKNLSNIETINLLDSFFNSESYYKIKFLSKEVLSKISEKINDESFSFYNTYFDEFFSDIKSVDDLMDSKYLSELNLEIDDFYQMKTDWDLYISDKIDFKNIINYLEIDDETIVLIIFVVWTFFSGAVAITFPEYFPFFVMLVESAIFGLIGSSLAGIIIDVPGNPLLEGIYNFLNNSTILKNFPVVKNILLGLVNVTIGIIESNSATIISAIGYSIGLTALATFLYLYSDIYWFEFITSGLWFILPPLLVKISFLLSGSNENTVKTSMFHPIMIN